MSLLDITGGGGGGGFNRSEMYKNTSYIRLDSLTYGPCQEKPVVKASFKPVSSATETS